MKVLAAFLLTLLFLTDPTLIGKINTLKSDAKKAYLKNDYKTAVKTYRFLIDSLQVREDEVMLNLASAYYNLKDTTNALNQYQSLTQSSKNYLRSKAQQQLGLIADQQGKSEEALNHFKQAIKSDLTNQEARYNYELLKKKLEEQKKQEQQNKDKNKDQDKKDQEKKEDEEKKDGDKKDDQQKKDQEQKEKEQKEKEKKEKEQKDKEEQKKDQEKKDKDQEQKEKEEQEKKEKEKKDMPPSVKDKLQQMQISEEKAKMLLEAMRAQEVQYLQQNKRKATKPKEKGKPDW